MPNLDVLFSTVENFHTMTVAHLQFSKIGKVMRHITLLTPDRVPRDAEFHFRERAKALVERWQLVLGAAKGGENGSKDGKEVNGSVKEDAKVNGNGDAKEEAKGDAKAVTDGAAAIDLNGTADAHADGDGE